MKFEYQWVPGVFKERPNRFIAYFSTPAGEVKAHVPNTGRLKELLLPGAEVMLSYHGEPHRKTQYELRLIRKDQVWVSVDSQLPNRVVEEGLQDGTIDDFGVLKSIRREFPFGKSRIDFLLQGEVPWLVEVKGVTLLKDKWSFFPDAPTERGTKHVYELMKAVQEGYCAGIVFLVQHPEAEGFTPNGQTDLPFARAVSDAQNAGVQVVAWRCHVDLHGVRLDRRIPVLQWEERI